MKKISSKSNYLPQMVKYLPALQYKWRIISREILYFWDKISTTAIPLKTL